jgi:hypothetical protein
MKQGVHLNLDPIKKKNKENIRLKRRRQMNRTCIIADGSDSSNGFFI